jgi:hypothetical protein
MIQALCLIATVIPHDLATDAVSKAFDPLGYIETPLPFLIFPSAKVAKESTHALDVLAATAISIL